MRRPSSFFRQSSWFRPSRRQWPTSAQEPIQLATAGNRLQQIIRIPIVGWLRVVVHRDFMPYCSASFSTRSQSFKAGSQVINSMSISFANLNIFSPVFRLIGHIHTRSYNFYTFGSSQFFQLFPGLGIQVETKDFIAPFSAQLMARIYFYILHSQFLSFIQRFRQRKEMECIRLYGYPPILFFRFRLFAGRQKACKQQKTNNGE